MHEYVLRIVNKPLFLKPVPVKMCTYTYTNTYFQVIIGQKIKIRIKSSVTMFKYNIFLQKVFSDI